MKSIKEYFSLQLKLNQRTISEFGINPILGSGLAIIVFSIFSYYLFAKSEYAVIIYAALAIVLALRLSDLGRNEFLKFTYSNVKFYLIRIIENMIVSLPFMLFLLYKNYMLYSSLLLLVSISLVFIQTNIKTNFTLPTPFYKFPYEFISGFRKSIVVIMLSYSLIFFSVINSNFNLGIFALVIIFLTCLNFYNESDNDYYVWVHAARFHTFIRTKIGIAILFSSLITLPILLTLLAFFNTYVLAILGFQLLGYFYLVSIILVRYANFPRPISFPHGILFALSIPLPILLLFTIPYFYHLSYQRLKIILG